MEKTVSDLNLEHLVSSEMAKNLQTSSEARTENQKRTERSNGAFQTTFPNPSRMLLTDAKAREREVIRKGIDRLEKQILQYIGVYISKDQVDIGHIKMCKFTDILALNTAMGNIQKSLQRYVGCDGKDPEYCNEIENLMDRAQVWGYRRNLRNINTSK